MTILLNGRFRSYLEAKTEMSRAEVRNTRIVIRNLALRYSHVSEVDRSKISEKELEALELFIEYRTKCNELTDEVNFGVEERSKEVERPA